MRLYQYEIATKFLLQKIQFQILQNSTKKTIEQNKLGTPNIYLKVKRKISNNNYSTEKETTNKITADTIVEIDLDDTVQNSVGNDILITL
jgi:predicted ribonuclease toxin of YeeF-YezG toxin-antitoxin module